MIETRESMQKSESVKDQNSRMLFSVALAMSAYLLAQVFGFLGAVLIGAGHGSAVFGYLFFSPIVGFTGRHIYFGLVLWPAIGFLLPWSRKSIVSCLVLILLGIIYFGIIQDITTEINEAGTTSYAVKVWKTFPGLVALIVSVFGLMQMAIWGSLIYLRASKPIKHD